MIQKLKKMMGSDKQKVKSLVRSAYCMEKLNDADIVELNKELPYLNLWPADLQRLKDKRRNFEKELPADKEEIYTLLYAVTSDLMVTHILGQKKQKLLHKIISLFYSNEQEINHVIAVMKRCVHEGHDKEEMAAVMMST